MAARPLLANMSETPLPREGAARLAEPRQSQLDQGSQEADKAGVEPVAEHRTWFHGGPPYQFGWLGREQSNQTDFCSAQSWP